MANKALISWWKCPITWSVSLKKPKLWLCKVKFWSLVKTKFRVIKNSCYYKPIVINLVLFWMTDSISCWTCVNYLFKFNFFYFFCNKGIIQIFLSIFYCLLLIYCFFKFISHVWLKHLLVVNWLMNLFRNRIKLAFQ